MDVEGYSVGFTTNIRGLPVSWEVLVWTEANTESSDALKGLRTPEGTANGKRERW